VTQHKLVRGRLYRRMVRVMPSRWDGNGGNDVWRGCIVLVMSRPTGASACRRSSEPVTSHNRQLHAVNRETLFVV
jgi:hypothetical protein